MLDPRKRSPVAAIASALFMISGLAAWAGTAGTSDTRLVDAARHQDKKAMRTLLSEKVDVNTRSSDGSTALLWLAHWNDLETANVLLSAGADANAANDFQMTPLSQACTNGSAAFVHALLKSHANPNTPIATGETPLMTCAKTGSVDAVRMLVEYGADVNAHEPKHDQTALMWAAAERHSDVVQALIAAHADLTAHSKEGFTAIHFAARLGDVETIKELLAAGVDVNLLTQAEGESNRVRSFLGVAKTIGTLGYTPLLVASVRGQVDTALFLLDHGADPNNEAAGFTPLHWACGKWESYTANPVYGFDDPMSGIPDRQAKLRLVKALLTHGVNVNARMTKPQPSMAGGYLDATGATAFVLAASANDLELMKILLAAGADPKILTATNASSIMAAAGLNRGIGEDTITEPEALATVDFLLKLGVDPKGETTFGENALFGPAYRGWNKLLAQLIDLGVNVNSVSKAGVTPYLAANGQGDRLGGVLYNKEGAQMLLEHGADPKLGHPCEAQNKCRADQ
ncbi:MAG TPA: ankyrin repeat domain-containing protein [Bryobacteraceae bacterium]|nr:ankyrin repeat domain-containing protein [Bryobacteraceae bacterium]